MKRKDYDLIEGDQTNLVILATRKDKSPVDLTGALTLTLYYTNQGIKTTRLMTAPTPANGKMAYRFLLNEIKAGDLEISGEIIDAANKRFTQKDPIHLSVGPRP